MVALAFSVLLTVYLIIPEAVFRVIFGSFLPTREFVLTRTETAYRAVVITLLPFALALALCWYVPGPQNWPFPVSQNTGALRRADYKVVSASFYSESEFAKSQTTFWPAFTRCSRRQARLVGWFYLLVAFEALCSGWLASEYAKFQSIRAYRWLADKFLLGYISVWHPLLTPYLLPDTQVQADLLCTNDTLYQGYVSKYFLSNGQLSGIILTKPRRFDREAYLKAKSTGTKPKKDEYWTGIPSDNLFFFADKIFNMNLRYVTVSGKIANLNAVEKFLAEEFSSLAKDLGKLTVSVGKEPSSGETRK